jgi:polyisoprenoid-binding protein YceI
MNLRIARVSFGLVSILAFGLALGLASAVSPGQAKGGATPNLSGSYRIDGGHSTVMFKIKHMNTSWTLGRFDNVTGNFTLNTASPEKSTVSVEVAADSVDTGVKGRDDHLKSDSFFDAVQFPSVSFASKSVKKAGEGKYTVEGDLSLHGVKKPLTVEFEQVGFSDSPKMGFRLGFFGTFTVKRSDFGMKYGLDGMVGDDVQMTISIEGIQTDAGAK